MPARRPQRQPLRRQQGAQARAPARRSPPAAAARCSPPAPSAATTWSPLPCTPPASGSRSRPCASRSRGPTTSMRWPRRPRSSASASIDGAVAPRRCRSCSHDAGPASRRPGRRSSPPAGRPRSAILGYVGRRPRAGRPASPHEGWDEPDDVVVALGSGGSSVGLSLGLALGGWRRATVVAVRVADRIVTNAPVLRGMEAGVRSLLALGGRLPAAGPLDDRRSLVRARLRASHGGRVRPPPSGRPGWGCAASRPTPRRPWPPPSSASTPDAGSCSCRPCRPDPAAPAPDRKGSKRRDRVYPLPYGIVTHRTDRRAAPDAVWLSSQDAARGSASPRGPCIGSSTRAISRPTGSGG